MNDSQLVLNRTQPAHWTVALEGLERSLDDPARGVSVLEQWVILLTRAAAELGSWAPVFEGWTVLARRYESVKSGEALTIWVSPQRNAIDLAHCRPTLDFRLFEADLVLGVWPELRWGSGGMWPGHEPSRCNQDWLELWQTIWRSAAEVAFHNRTGDDIDQQPPDYQLQSFAAFSRLTAMVFARRRGEESLAMPAEWRLGLLKNVRAFESAAVGAAGGRSLARPGSKDAAAGFAVASGCCALFHHAFRGLDPKARVGRPFGEAMDDLIAAPFPKSEVPGSVWHQGARRNLERLLRFWAASDATLLALLESALRLSWGDARAALPAPEQPAPQEVFERIALLGGSNVGKTSFLFGSEHLRQNTGKQGVENDLLPVIEHAWLEGSAATQEIDVKRQRWRAGQPSRTERPELVAVTGVHSFQAFEIVDMKGEDLAPPINNAMNFALRDIFTFRPPAAIALMLDGGTPLSNSDLQSHGHLVRLAIEAHCRPSSNAQTDPTTLIQSTGSVPPIHLIANKADLFIAGTSSEPLVDDAAVVDALCSESIDLGLLMRRAKYAQGSEDNDSSIFLSLVMREALESKTLSASPTIGVAVDRLLEREGALISTLMSKQASNVVLNFTCSSAPGGVQDVALAGIGAFWSELWSWAHARRHQALNVQKDGFIDQTEKDGRAVKTLLTSGSLAFAPDTKNILAAYKEVVKLAGTRAKIISARLKRGDTPTTVDNFATWLGADGNDGSRELGNAVDRARKHAADAEIRLKAAVDTTISNLITLLGIDPEARLETMLDRQRYGDIVNQGQDWLDEMQGLVAGQRKARSVPPLIASDDLPQPLVQADALLANVESKSQDDGFRLLTQLLEQQRAGVQRTASIEKALPGGPDSNPHLFHRIHGALLDDCFLKNERWRKDRSNESCVALLLRDALLGVKALLIERAGPPNLESTLGWRDTLAPLLRLLAEYKPMFPQLVIRRFDTDAVKVAVLAKMTTRRRVEKLIAALEVSLRVRAQLVKMPGIAARVRQLTTVESMLPALRELGFDATNFEELVRRGSAEERRMAIEGLEDGPPGLITIQNGVRAQVGLWPRGLLSLIKNTAPALQVIRANIALLRMDLSGRFGSHILPEPNQETSKSLLSAVTSLQAGVRLLEASAGSERHEEKAIEGEMRELGSKIAEMQKEMKDVGELIRTDILVERYRRFLALKLEENESTIGRLNDGLDVVDGGIVRTNAGIPELEGRYLEIMREYFNERDTS